MFVGGGNERKLRASVLAVAVQGYAGFFVSLNLRGANETIRLTD